MSLHISKHVCVRRARQIDRFVVLIQPLEVERGQKHLISRGGIAFSFPFFGELENVDLSISSRNFVIERKQPLSQIDTLSRRTKLHSMKYHGQIPSQETAQKKGLLCSEKRRRRATRTQKSPPHSDTRSIGPPACTHTATWTARSGPTKLWQAWVSRHTRLLRSFPLQQCCKS